MDKTHAGLIDKWAAEVRHTQVSPPRELPQRVFAGICLQVQVLRILPLPYLLSSSHATRLASRLALARLHL
jgi:hypothetical protein